MSKNITVIRSGYGGGRFIHGNINPIAALTIKPAKEVPISDPHKSATPSTVEEEGKKEWIPWGASDNFPLEIHKLMQKTTVGRAGLQKLTKIIHGQRLITFKIKDITDGGKEVIEYIHYPDWKLLQGRSNTKIIRLAQAQDYVWFALAYAEIIFTDDKSAVYSINYQKTSHCRLAPRDPATGRIPFIYVSGNFPEAKPEDCQKIAVIDMINYADQMEDIRTDMSTHKYLMPLFWPDVVNDYYPIVAWDSARQSGYLDIAISIPVYTKHLFKNQMSLKYDIKIPIEYFRLKYTNFDAKSDDDKDKIFQDLYDEITLSLTGAENAQKALMSFYETDRNGKAGGKWEITVIDDKMKSGAYLPDATAADFQISYAMGLNPNGSGQGTTSGSNKGGGSDIREAGLDLRSQLRADRDILLSWFDFVKIYNGWDPDLEVGIQDQVLTTLDEGRGTKKVVS